MKNFLKNKINGKNLEIIVAVVLIGVVLALLLSELSLFTPVTDVSDVETRVQTALSNIEGVGKVSVTISYQSTAEQVYAYESKTVTNGTTTTVTNEIITNKGEPLVVKENLPPIQGVVVVASGGSNASVRARIITALTTLLDVQPSQIQIFTYKK